MDNLVVTTWSHSTYNDIWPLYYGQFGRHAPFFNHALFVEKELDAQNCPDGVRLVPNQEKDAYFKRWVDCMERIKEDNVMYMQEDFVLYGDVSESGIKSIQEFLNNSNYCFVRLIKSGVEGGTLVNEDLNMWELPQNCPYYFSCNAAIWKRSSFIKLFNFFKPQSMLDSELYGSMAMKTLDMKGCYIYNGEPKRGSLHYDSEIFPYISTALVGHSLGGPSRWLYKHYRAELETLLGEYQIDPMIRGILE